MNIVTYCVAFVVFDLRNVSHIVKAIQSLDYGLQCCYVPVGHALPLLKCGNSFIQFLDVILDGTVIVFFARRECHQCE